MHLAKDKRWIDSRDSLESTYINLHDLSANIFLYRTEQHPSSSSRLRPRRGKTQGARTPLVEDSIETHRLSITRASLSRSTDQELAHNTLGFLISDSFATFVLDRTQSKRRNDPLKVFSFLFLSYCILSYGFLRLDSRIDRIVEGIVVFLKAKNFDFKFVQEYIWKYVCTKSL